MTSISDDTQHEVWGRSVPAGNSTYVTTVRVGYDDGQVALVALKVLKDGTVRPGPAGAVGFTAEEWGQIVAAVAEAHRGAAEGPDDVFLKDVPGLPEKVRLAMKQVMRESVDQLPREWSARPPDTGDDTAA